MEPKIRHSQYALALTLALGAVIFCGVGIPPANAALQTLSTGLELYEAKDGLAKGLHALIVNPTHFRLRLLTAGEEKLKENLPAKDWAEKFKLIAAINAGMYHKDYRTSVGLLVNQGKANNAKLNPKYKAVLVFDPIAANPKDRLAEAVIIDRDCQNFDAYRPHYRSFLQSIRMVTCRQESTWKKNDGRWPIAALAATREGKILFLFNPNPLTPDEFIRGAMGEKLGIHNMMYLEGGPPAQFYLKYRDIKIDFTGSYRNAQTETSLPIRTAIPNVLAVVTK